MIDITNLWHYELREGKTSHPRNGACLFDAGMWLVYGRIGDNPPCSCPVIRNYAIGLNDLMDDVTRQRLKPFILRVVGNRDPAAEPARLRHIVLETARRVVPLAFDARHPALAAEMRALPDDISYVSLEAFMALIPSRISGVDAAHAAAHAAARATIAAAATGVTAAEAAADPTIYIHAADAGYAAVAAVHAATGVTAAEAAAVWTEAIAILDGALRIGKQAPDFDPGEVRAAVAAFDRARETVGD